MRAIANASIDAREVEYLQARPGGLERNDPAGVVVVEELEARVLALEAALQAQINQKVGVIEIDNALIGLVKEFTLTGGVESRQVNPNDGNEYTYTVFEVPTGFGGLNFRAFDLSETLDPFRKVGFLYSFEKFGVDSARVTFQSSETRFPDDTVSIALVRIPQRVTNAPATLGFSVIRAGVGENTPVTLTFSPAPAERLISFRSYDNGGVFKNAAVPANTDRLDLTATFFTTDSDITAANLPMVIYADLAGIQSQAITLNP